MKSDAEEEEFVPLRFVGLLLHDTLGPIRAAAMQARLLAEEARNSKVKELAFDVLAACSYAEQRLRRAQVLLRLQRNYPAQKRRSRGSLLAKKISTTVDLIRTRAGRKDLRMVVDLEKLENSSISIDVDPDLFFQAIWSVVENAVHYSFSGGLIRLEALLQEDWLVISTTSKGLEVSQEEVKQCTQLGWRGSRASQVTSGYGAGLFIAARTMELHGGALEIKPVGDVTTVCLRFCTSIREKK